jgi:hypothetical protein
MFDGLETEFMDVDALMSANLEFILKRGQIKGKNPSFKGGSVTTRAPE